MTQAVASVAGAIRQMELGLQDVSRHSVQVAGIQDSTRQAVATITGLVRTVNDISELSNNIATDVEVQTATTAAISLSVSQAADHSGEVARNVQQGGPGRRQGRGGRARRLHGAGASGRNPPGVGGILPAVSAPGDPAGALGPDGSAWGAPWPFPTAQLDLSAPTIG